LNSDESGWLFRHFAGLADCIHEEATIFSLWGKVFIVKKGGGLQA